MKVLFSLGLLALIVGSLIIITAGVVGWVVVPNVIEKKIKEETRLAFGSETWEKWVNIKVPIQLKFYIYNITNPDADLTNEKLIFDEIGPYVYNEERTKTISAVDDFGEDVTYKQKITYYFDQEASGDLSEDDLFNIPNVPLISVATVGYSTGNPLAGSVINSLTKAAGETFVQKDVAAKDLLFDGWKINPLYALTGTPDFKGNLFGFYRFKNGSDDGEYVVKTGIKDHTEFGQISEWEGMEELEWWYTDTLEKNSSEHYCNKINGSDGSIFPPFNTKDTTLRIFQTEICRSIYLTYNSKTTYKDIPGYRYTIPMEMFDHPDKNEDNKCFCPNPSGAKELAHQCGQSIIRIFPCKHGAPIVTSNARFLDGAAVVTEPIEIEKPDREVHETFVEIEPDSGMVLRISKKIQINVELQNIPGYNLFSSLNFTKFTKAPSVLLPAFWAEEYVALDDEDAEDLYDKLIKPQKIVDIAKWVVIGIGGLLILIGGVLVFKG